MKNDPTPYLNPYNKERTSFPHVVSTWAPRENIAEDSTMQFEPGDTITGLPRGQYPPRRERKGNDDA